VAGAGAQAAASKAAEVDHFKMKNSDAPVAQREEWGKKKWG
jgi:hypothetical protein